MATFKTPAKTTRSAAKVGRKTKAVIVMVTSAEDGRRDRDGDFLLENSFCDCDFCQKTVAVMVICLKIIDVIVMVTSAKRLLL